MNGTINIKLLNDVPSSIYIYIYVNRWVFARCSSTSGWLWNRRNFWKASIITKCNKEFPNVCMQNASHSAVLTSPCKVNVDLLKGKGKGKVTPPTGPVVAQGVGRSIALLLHDLGARRGWVVSSTPRPYFTPEKEPVPIVQEAGWAPGPVWTGGKSRPTGIRSPNRPARSSVAIPTELTGNVDLLLRKTQKGTESEWYLSGSLFYQNCYTYVRMYIAEI